MSSVLPYLLFKSYGDVCVFRYARIVTIFFLFFFPVKGFGQEENGYEEVSVLFSVPRIGNTEIPSLIKNEEAYLAVKEVFDYLKIKNTISVGLDSLSGFFIDPKTPYLIDKIHNRISFRNTILDLSPSDLVLKETGLYLKSTVFCQVFGLDCQFSFRNLSFTLKTSIELPVFREMQQEQLRKNIRLLKGEKKADTILKRNFSLFHLGVADWSVTATQETGRKSALKADLALGATLAGGEVNLLLNHNSSQPIKLSRQFYRWRYVNNDLSIVKQISVGRVSAPLVSSLFVPVNGIQITNTPSTYRKSFGSYRYTGTTEPDWMVEIYVNNILVNYVRADASGFFAFDIPIVYGNSAIRLKFYGPWGEENTREENISIPFNFLPVRKFEYTISSGVAEDEIHSRFLRGSFNYGLNKRFTVGGGTEYLSSVMSGKPMPFVNASMRLGSGLVLNGEYVRGVRLKAALNYRLPSSFQLDLSYMKYQKEQTAVRFNYLRELRASLSAPIHLKKFTAFSRLTYNQFVSLKYRYGNAEFLFSTNVAGAGASFRTFVQFSGLNQPYISSDLSLSCRLPYGIRFTPQVQYRYNPSGFNSVKAEAEKRISEKSYLNLSYENNFLLHSRSFTLGLRYDLSFARTFFAARRGNKTTVTTQSASGTLLYDGKVHYLELRNQSSSGKGGFLVVPFLDLNCNGRREAGEPGAAGLNLRVSGGRVERRKDSSLLITGLEAYTSYLLELDKSSFDNISWQIKNATIRVTVEPNRLRLIEVPVAVLGEASGMVYLQKGQWRKGLSRILVNFYDSTSSLVAKTLTEADGYFNYLGLSPGTYKASIDTAQLRILNLTTQSRAVTFTIAGSEEGTIADGFEFILNPVYEEPQEPAGANVKEKSIIKEKGKAEPVGKLRSLFADQTVPEVQRKKQVGSQNLPSIVISNQASGKGPGFTNREGKGLVAPARSSNVPEGIVQTFQAIHKRESSSRVPGRPKTNKKSLPVRNNNLAFFLRQRLMAEQQKLDKKQQQVLGNLKRLIHEQQALIQKQRELIKEIQWLKLQLQLNNQKIRQPKK